MTLLPLMLAGVFLFFGTAQGVQIQIRSLKIQNSQATAVNTYELTFQHITNAPIGSIRVQFCANDPLIGQPCTAPSGFSLSAAALASQSGMVGFSIDPATTANVLILSRSPSTDSAPVQAVYGLQNIRNPDSPGTYYVRVETFASIDATGVNTDYGGIAFRINGGLAIQTEVPPFLLFCVANIIASYDCNSATGNYIDFGNFTPTKTATGQTQALVATNAEFGYTIRALGTTLTSGIHTIPALGSSDVSRLGVSQFGMNLRANGTPSIGLNPQGPGTGSPTSAYNNPNFYSFVPGDVIASSVTTDAYRLYTMSYIANVSSSQAPGIYVSTLQYVALATF